MSGGDHSEGHESAMHRLKGLKSIREILDTAMGFEKTARDFYAGLQGRVGKPIRELVSELAQEEQRHYELFERLRDDANIASELTMLIATPVSDHKFSDYVQTPQLGEHPDDQAVLQYALAREHAAAEHYGALAQTAPQGPIGDLFRFLADEELRHKGELEKLYYEIVHSGGV